jgi:hypothetical protein
LAWAIVLGVTAQTVLLAFGLHASLFLSWISVGSERLYWVLNGVYLVIGIAAFALLIPWCHLKLRSLVAAFIVLLGVVIGLIFPW